MLHDTGEDKFIEITATCPECEDMFLTEMRTDIPLGERQEIECPRCGEKFNHVL